MRVVGIVTARGGSKGIPQKNIRLLRGKPLLQYTAEAALAAKRLERVILSTDDPTIAQVGRDCGLEAPFMRPLELAQDNTPSIPVLQHAVAWLQERGECYDAVCLLQPTNPLRQSDDIDGAISLLERTGADSVISFYEVGEKHPARMKMLTSDGRVIDPPFAETFEGQRRQELPRLYLREGGIYVTRTDVLMNQHSLKGRDCRGWLVDVHRACAIDGDFDLFLAEQMLRNQDEARRASKRKRPVTSATTAAPPRAAPDVEPHSCIAKPKIVVAESSGFSPQALHELQTLGSVVLADATDRSQLVELARDANVLWVRLRHLIDETVLAMAHGLKAVVTPTTGLNHVDLAAASRHGVQVLSLRGETEFLRDVRATAEHTIGLMLSLIRHVPAALEHVRSGGWDRDLFKGRELRGATVGLVGYGRLGQLVARYLKAFDARVIVSDPYVQTVHDTLLQCLPLPELLARADIVSLHVNLCDATWKFFGAAELASMKSDAVLINTARGELIDESALLASLESGRLAGAALDVLAGETSLGMGQHPLVSYSRGHDNLLITPHIGGCTSESMVKTEDFLARKLCSLLARESDFAMGAGA